METEVSNRFDNFVLHMYNHLTREQRYGIYLGLHEKKLNFKKSLGTN